MVLDDEALSPSAPLGEPTDAPHDERTDAFRDAPEDVVELDPQVVEPPRSRLVLLVAPIVVMVAAGWVAGATWPTLSTEHPLWLLGLSAQNRYCVMVVNQVDLWAYYLVGTARLLAPDPFFFAIGWFYGSAGLRWMERRSPTAGSIMTRLEVWFKRWGNPLVFFFPNNYVCLIAGAARMSILRFAILNVLGTIGRLLLLQLVGDVFSGPIDWFLDLVSGYRIPLLVVSTVTVAVIATGQLRRGRRDIEELEQLEPEHRSEERPEGK